MDVVLADDFSGAAEIAGIAARNGRRVEMHTHLPKEIEDDVDVLILDTDTRLLNPVEAAQSIEAVGRMVRGWNPNRVFKKIDSVLRGPVAEEIEAALDGLGLTGAVVCSANPGKGRIIAEGRYLVQGVPLHQTVLADDPIHPATTSVVRERVGNSSKVSTPDASSVEEIQSIVENLSPGELAVGAADFFRAWIGADDFGQAPGLPEGSRLWICGSQTVRDVREAHFRQSGVPVVYLGPEYLPATQTADQAIACLQADGLAAVELDQRVDVTAENTDLLLQALKDMAGKLLNGAHPALVFMEGGATARAVMDTMRWSEFRVEGEFSPGVVCLEPKGAEWSVQVVVKPGSYSWPPRIFP